MLRIIRPPSYHTNLVELTADFYNYLATEDELASKLLAKNIRKLLERSPSVIAKQLLNDVDYEVKENQFQVSNENEIFNSDSSLSSICSTMSSDSWSSSSGIFSSVTEQTGKPQSGPRFKVVLPHRMMARLVRDIVRMGEGEPNGIRGCHLQMELADDDDDAVYRIGRISCDPKIPTSYSLRVRLVSGVPPQNTSSSSVTLSRLFKTSNQPLYIKPGYFIEKVKQRS